MDPKIQTFCKLQTKSHHKTITCNNNLACTTSQMLLPPWAFFYENVYFDICFQVSNLDWGWLYKFTLINKAIEKYWAQVGHRAKEKNTKYTF